MNTKIILFIIAGILILIVALFYNALSKTTWGGWTPPDNELELNSTETTWKEKIEKEYNCKIDYIGLGNDYKGSEVIYMNLKCQKPSLSNINLASNPSFFAKKICDSFMTIIQKKRTQTIIQIRYLSLVIDGKIQSSQLVYFYDMTIKEFKEST